MTVRILVAEDDASRDGLAELLEDDGFEVATARDGEDALRQVNARAPDLLITDLRMPGMTGIELICRLRREGYELPVIVVSAYDGEERSARVAGATEFLPKPLDYTQLARTLLELYRNAPAQPDAVKGHLAPVR